MHLNMHISVFLGILLVLAVARPNLYEDSQTPVTVITSRSLIEYTSDSSNLQMTGPAMTTSRVSPVGSIMMESSPQAQITSELGQSTDIMTMTQLTTVTQTSFVPVSTLITQFGSIVYYSTWLSVVYPTTVVTSVEYITGSILTVTERSTETVSVEITSMMTYECVCPLPDIETVYVFATIGPIMTITSAILVPLDLTSLGQQAVTTSVPIATITSGVLLSASITSPSLGPSIISSPNKDQSSNTQSAFTTYGNSTLTSNATGLTRSPIVSQFPDGQLVIPLVG